MRAARAGRRIVMRPTEHGFVGPLAGELEEYIRFKASMGRHGATRVRVLRSFDRHCLEHGAVRLERGVVERWIAHRIDANPGGCRSWFSYIRDFGRWMRLAHDPDAYVLSDQWKAGSPLHDKQWNAVRVMVPKAKVNQLMDKLYEVGARAIIVTALQASRM